MLLLLLLTDSSLGLGYKWRALSDEMEMVTLRYPHISHTVKSSMKENLSVYAYSA